MKTIWVLIFIWLGLTSKSYSKEYSLFNYDEIIFQTGSYTGFMTFGPRYFFGDHFSSEILLGFTPHAIALEDQVTISSKNLFHSDYHIFNSLRPISIYGGLTLIHLINDDDTFFFLPSKYPKGYYPPTSVRTTLNIGFTIDSFFLELSSLDILLENYFRSDQELTFEQIFTYGFGWIKKY